MVRYKNETFLKDKIVQRSMHFIIYGEDHEYRSQFLKSLENEYPLVLDSDKPVALYFDSFGLPSFSNKQREGEYLADICTRSYLDFSVAAKILEKLQALNIEAFESRLARLISLTNYSISQNKAQNIGELLGILKQSRDFYYEKGVKYIKGEIDNFDRQKAPCHFVMLEQFVEQIKEAIGMNSHFNLILDKKDPLAIVAVRYVNALMGSRINKHLSVNLAVAPGEWPTFYDNNGNLISGGSNDYDTIDLDGSYARQLELKRRERNIFDGDD